MKVKVWNYGKYINSNYGSSRAVQVGNLTLYFSYRTVIAFQDGYSSLVITENMWGRTTGKHLNWINSDKSRRISYVEFKQKLEDCLKVHDLD